MKKILYVCALSFGMLIGCSPAMYTNMQKTYEPTPRTQSIDTYSGNDAVPVMYEVLGDVKFRDTGFSTECSYDQVMAKAHEQAREVGGQAIIVTNIKEPGFVSTCYRMDVRIIRYERYQPTDLEIVEFTEEEIYDYLDSNTDELNIIEGIWSVNMKTYWNNRSNSDSIRNMFKLYIFKNQDARLEEYKAIILSSSVERWDISGALIGNIEGTAYRSEFLANWTSMLGNSVSANLSIKENGILSGSFEDGDFDFEMEMIKQYPLYSNSAANHGNQVATIVSSGTSFAVNTTGLFTTNYHVVKGSEEVTITCADADNIKREYDANVVINDSANDLSLIQINDSNFEKFKELPYKLSTEAKVGDAVYTIGYPLNDVMGQNSKLSNGVVSSRSGIQDDARYLQITAPLQPGNSGGPLLTSDGELVGIVTARLNSEAVGTKIENVNYAIKADYLSALLNMVPSYTGGEPSSVLKGKLLSEQVELISPFVCKVSAIN